MKFLEFATPLFKKKEKKEKNFAKKIEVEYKEYNYVFFEEQIKMDKGVKKIVNVYKKYGYNRITKNNDFIELVIK